jgi:hypothetical protein
LGGTIKADCRIWSTPPVPRTPRQPNPQSLKTFFYLNELRPGVNRENTSRETAATRRRFPKASKGQHERAAA